MKQELPAEILSIFDRRPKKLLKESTLARLKSKVLSERDLVAAASQLKGQTVEEYVKAAVLRQARADHTMAEKKRYLHGKPAPGLSGAADPRLGEALEGLRKEGRKVSISALRIRARCSFAQAKQWADKKGLSL